MKEESLLLLKILSIASSSNARGLKDLHHSECTLALAQIFSSDFGSRQGGGAFVFQADKLISLSLMPIQMHELRKAA